MDFNRSSAPFRPDNGSGNNVPSAAKDTTKKGSSLKQNTDWFKFSHVTLLFAGLIVAIGAIILLAIPENNKKYINTDGYQTVGVVDGVANGGQVYFGKITAINDRQIVLSSVFYPVANENSTNTTLLPFVCSVASPTDQLVLNRDQVAYWYNLQSESKVAKTIDEFKKTNNSNVDCSKLNNSSSTTDEAANKTEDKTTDTPATNTGTNTPANP